MGETYSRTYQARAAGPETLDENTRSVGVVAATEAPVSMYDHRGEFPQVLLGRACTVPGNGQVPLLDSHARHSLDNVLGSARDFTTDDSGQLIGRAYFADTEAGRAAFALYRDGHATDVSVGYRVNTAEWIPQGERRDLAGASYEGPMEVVTSWSLRELSACPIGADPDAKARSEQEPEPKEATTMPTPEEIAEQARKDERAKEDARNQQIADTARAEERERCREIRAQWAPLDPARGEQLIDSGASLEKSTSELADAYKAERSNRDGFTPDIIVGEEAREKCRTYSADALLARCGEDIPAERLQGNPCAGLQIMDVARHSLQVAGKDSRGGGEDLMKRALTDSDLPYTIANVGNKFVLRGHEQAETTYQQWADLTGTATKVDETISLLRPSEISAMEEVNSNNGEYKFLEVGEERETLKVQNHGGILPIAMKVLINDDLNTLQDLNTRLGEGAHDDLDDAVYALFTSASGAGETMGDGNTLWDATNHSNYIAAGSGAAPSVTTLNAGFAAMVKQKGVLSERFLGWSPKVLLVPPDLYGSGSQLVANTTPNAPADVNPFSYLKLVWSAKLSAEGATMWYLLARPNRTVKVFYLNGAKSPQLAVERPFYRDGIEMKVNYHWGVKTTDWRGVFKNHGA